MILLFLFLTFHPIPGEKIVMDVYFGPLKAGKLVLKVMPDVKIINRIPCYHLNLRLKTTGLFSSIFKVDDEIQSLIDTTSLHTLVYSKKLREGKYRASSYVFYSFKDSLAVYPDTTVKTPPFYDPLSLIYLARSVAEGETLAVTYHVDRITTTAKVYVVEHESVMGRDARKVVIAFSQKGLFKDGGNFFMWISTDSAWREPLKIQSKLKIGSITGILSKYIPGKSS